MDQPRITVVTPTLNQAAYLGETIESVLDQRYPKLEYIVMDGGSTDSTRAVIERYARHLAHWESGPDGGQAEALRKGFGRATGEVLAWLNSDDCYEPGALQTAAEGFLEWPDAVLVYGDYYVVDGAGNRELKRKVSFDFSICLYAYLMIPQPSAFWTRDVYEAVGGIDRRLRYSMDYDLFLRIGHGREEHVRHVRRPLSRFRLHDGSKSVAQMRGFAAENDVARSRFVPPSGPAFRARRAFQSGRLAYRFLRERRFVPLRKDRRKA